MIATRLALAAAIAVASSAMAFAPQASASDGTITITGKVLDSTCSVSAGTNMTGSGSSLAVELDPVQSTALQDPASSTGEKDFTLALSGCPTTPSGVKVGTAFSGSGIDTVNGVLTNTGSAQKVSVALTPSGGGTAYTLTNDASTIVGDTATIDSNGVASLTYGAEYYSVEGGATAGTVTASVAYTLIYQ